MSSMSNCSVICLLYVSSNFFFFFFFLLAVILSDLCSDSSQGFSPRPPLFPPPFV